MKTLDSCKEIMKFLVERGFASQVQRTVLEKTIMVLRGMDKRTVQNWLRTLESLGFIKAVNPYVFELKFDQCPELLNVIIENGQKKLM